LRYQFWASFCFACLGAIGLNQAMEGKGSRYRQFLPPTIVLLLLTVLVWRLRPDRPAEIVFCALLLCVSMGLLIALSVVSRPLVIWLMVAANLLLLVDLSYFRVHANYAPSMAITDALGKDGMAGWLTQDTGRFRIFSLFTERDLQLRQQNVLTGSSPTLWGLESVGYHGSLQLRRYEKVLDGLSASLLSGGTEAQRLAPFLAFLKAKYVIAPHGVAFDGWDKANDGVVTAWRNPEFHEGEFLVGRVQRENNTGDEHVFEEIRSNSIDFRRVAVIAADSLPRLDGLGNRAEVRSVPAQYDAMEFQVDSDRPALLAIPNNYYPGWTATVNGAPARIYRTNWIGMGVLVNAGESRIVLRFAQPGLHTGLAISLLSLLCWAVIALWFRGRSRRANG
jgi:hypothetical protein